MKIIFLFLVVLSFNSDGFCQESRMIDQIRSQKTGTSVWWAGQDSWIIKSEGLVVATDLFLENTGRIAPAPVTPEEIAGVLDISFIY